MAARMALDNAFSVLSAAQDLRLQSEQLNEVARGEFRPKATLNLGAQRVGTRADESSVSLANQKSSTLTTAWKLHSGTSLSTQVANSLTGTARATTVTVGITQPLLRGFGKEVTTASLRATEIALEVARLDFEQIATDAVFNALQTYFDRNLATQRVTIARDSLETAQRMHDVNRTLVDVGRSAANVLLQSEADLAQSRLALAQAEQDENVAKRALLVAIGAEASAIDADVATPDRVDQYINMAMPTLREATDTALALQSSTRISRENLKVAELLLLQAEDQLRLPLNLSVSASRATSGAPASGRTDASVGLSTEIAFDRSDLRFAKSSASVGVRKAQMQLAETERTVRHAVADAVYQHEFAVQQLALARSGAEIGRRRLQMELEKQRLGRSSALELSTTRREVADAENQVVQASHQVLRSQLDLWKITGRLLAQWGLDNQVERWSREIVR